MIRKVITSASSAARTIRFHSSMSPLVQSLYNFHFGRSFIGNQGWAQTHHAALSISTEHMKYMSTQSSSLLDSLNETDTAPEKGMPFKRSQKSTEAKRSVFLFDARAEAKILALNQSKENADKAKAKYKTRKQNKQPGDAYLAQLQFELITSQQQLALAYSQAIKYCSRIPNNPDATVMAENLLYEWMDRFWDGFSKHETNIAVDKNASMKKKWMIKTIHALLPLATNDPKDVPRAAIDAFAGHHVSPPTSKDYINLLRSYSTSKARRKGEQAEALIVNMLMLAEALSKVGCGYESTAEVVAERELYASWIKENIPTSKMFALAVKCYAGSTHKDSLDKIYLLNYIHDEFTSANKNKTLGLYTNDPYVLLHSIKALRNYQIEEERQRGLEWLEKLHDFVTDAENRDYFLEEGELKRVESEKSDATDQNDDTLPSAQCATASQVDVTSAYVTVIRQLARLRGEKTAASDACNVLDRMHVVHDTMTNKLVGNDGASKSIAFIDIKSNAYNLVLGLCRDSKQGEDATKAVKLLERMIDVGKKDEDERNGVPLPTHQSFEYTILALAKMNDSSAAINEAERLITEMEDYLDHSITVYNALLTLCSKTLYDKPELYDKALEIFGKLNETCKVHPALAPDSETKSLVIKACAHSKREDHEAVLGTATTIFSELVAQEKDERSARFVTDNCYYHMMMCVMNHMTEDEEAKKEQLEELFSQACQRGLCSSAILNAFRNNTSDEEYRLTVGKGRLADGWVANVTSPRALYTDGSSRGAGKHARRAGKSTSGWAKKQKQKEAQRKSNKDAKRVKKMLKTL